LAKHPETPQLKQGIAGLRPIAEFGDEFVGEFSPKEHERKRQRRQYLPVHIHCHLAKFQFR
jgi:hypothetical protein